jgi:geranylgeranylglycerol-phosphate geranylgeranyltransferase
MHSICQEFSKLILPEYFIITILTILIAGLYNQNLTLHLIPLILIFTLLMIGLNSFNSLFDIEIDKLNKPTRPNVSGKINTSTINMVWASSFLLAALLAFFLDLGIFFLTLLGIIIAIAYSAPPLRLRNHFISSGFVGGFTYGAFPYLIVTFLSNNPINLSHTLLFFGILFAITPLKDIEDIFGDKQNNIKSFPVLFGEIKTIHFTTITLFVISSVFVVLNINKDFLILIPFFLTILIIYSLNKITKMFLKKDYRRATQSHIVTIAMLAVLLIEASYGLIVFLT